MKWPAVIFLALLSWSCQPEPAHCERFDGIRFECFKCWWTDADYRQWFDKCYRLGKTAEELCECTHKEWIDFN